MMVIVPWRDKDYKDNSYHAGDYITDIFKTENFIIAIIYIYIYFLQYFSTIYTYL